MSKRYTQEEKEYTEVPIFDQFSPFSKQAAISAHHALLVLFFGSR
jgi:hypothetical protein